MFPTYLKSCFSSESTVELIRKMKKLRMIFCVFRFIQEAVQEQGTGVHGDLGQMQASRLSEEKTCVNIRLEVSDCEKRKNKCPARCGKAQGFLCWTMT